MNRPAGVSTTLTSRRRQWSGRKDVGKSDDDVVTKHHGDEDQRGGMMRRDEEKKGEPSSQKVDSNRPTHFVAIRIVDDALRRALVRIQTQVCVDNDDGDGDDDDIRRTSDLILLLHHSSWLRCACLEL